MTPRTLGSAPITGSAMPPPPQTMPTQQSLGANGGYQGSYPAYATQSVPAAMVEASVEGATGQAAPTPSE